MNSYSIEIPNAKAGTYKLVTFFIAAINILVFGYLIFSAAGSNFQAFIIIGFVLNVVALALMLLQRRLQKRSDFKPEISFLISAVIWAITGKYVIALLMIIFAVIGFYANKKLLILINEDGITYPSFPQKIFLWQNVSQVILKDDILTIDLKNNQLLQFNLSEAESGKINTIAFNDFCKQKAATFVDQA